MRVQSAGWSVLSCVVALGMAQLAGSCAPQAAVEESQPPSTDSVSSALVSGCADGTAEQVFGGGMVGCAGTVTWADRNSLCAPGFRAARAHHWQNLNGGDAPTHHYWTNDDLRYSGTSTSCAAVYTTGFACTAGQPMRVCAPGGTDPEGNQCNWTNCGLGSTTPNAYFGGCNGNTTAGTLCIPHGCADGTVEQVFSNGMIGCAGTVTHGSRASLCAPGYRVATSYEWVNYRGGAAPTHNYWTNEELRYNGTATSCYVNLSGAACPSGQPMRVCTATGTDPEGNQCNWVNCGYYSATPNQYFGGCVGNTTAGVLCLPMDGCADGTVEQVFQNDVVGCAGSVTWANRDSLCAPGWRAGSASDWKYAHGAVAPSHNYWTSDDLRYNGTGSSACYVSTTVGNSCPGEPMRLCTPSGTDPEGNQCNWTHCGLDTTTPDQYFGGCVGNTSAGTFCIYPIP